LRAESRSADEGVYGGDEVGSEVVVAVNLAGVAAVERGRSDPAGD
jgi:hypothetical protein